MLVLGTIVLCACTYWTDDENQHLSETSWPSPIRHIQ